MGSSPVGSASTSSATSTPRRQCERKSLVCKWVLSATLADLDGGLLTWRRQQAGVSNSTVAWVQVEPLLVGTESHTLERVSDWRSYHPGSGATVTPMELQALLPRPSRICCLGGVASPGKCCRCGSLTPQSLAEKHEVDGGKPVSGIPGSSTT
jgi:hypothetical protein